MPTGPALVTRLVYGEASEQPKRPPPARWLRSSAGQAGLRLRCGELLCAYLVRSGGALPAVVFDPEGRRVARGPVWLPAIAALGDWRLSGAASDLLLALLASEEGVEPPVITAVTSADILFRHALLERLELQPDVDRRWLRGLRAADPWQALLNLDEPTAAADPLVRASWLVPFLQDHIVRRWLTIDSRRRLMDRPEQAALNLRLAAWQDRLWRLWRTTGRAEHLTLFCSFYQRWLRARDGVRGLLRLVRGGPSAGGTVQEREQWELSFGRLFEPAVGLAALAAELRGYGWQRTAAEEHFLGVYSREVEPLADDLRHLHAELCRML